VDPKWYVQQALLFTGLLTADWTSLELSSIRKDDPRLDFYAAYKREVTEHDTGYVKKYDEDFNATPILARRTLSTFVGYITPVPPVGGLFCAVSSPFVIDVYSNLRSDRLAGIKPRPPTFTSASTPTSLPNSQGET